jgi:hypothetical protein
MNLRTFILLPHILLVRFLARRDPRLFRYWNVESLQNWRRIGVTWRAYAIAAAGWAIVAGVMWLAVRWL